MAHCTKAEREKHLQRTLDDVRTREEAVARCTEGYQQKSAQKKKKQARKARAQRLVKCCLAFGKKKASRKLLTEFYVDGHFTEDREEWQKEARRHCEDIYTDHGERQET